MPPVFARLQPEPRIEPEDVAPVRGAPAVSEAAEARRDAAARPDTPSEPRANPLAAPGAQIQSVDRALRILELVAEAGRPVKLQEIATSLALKLPTCHHLVQALVARNYLCRLDRAGVYAAGPQLGRLARVAAPVPVQADSALLAALEALAQDTGMTTAIVLLRGADLLLGPCATVPGGVSITAWGQNIALAPHATAPGKAILAWLPEAELATIVGAHGLSAFTPRSITTLADLVESLRQVRRHGFALEDGEFINAISGISVAIRDGSGRVIGALCCMMARNSDELVRMRKAVAPVIRAALQPCFQRIDI